MKIIGLSGGIASGKSTAAKFLVERGIAVIDCDVVARDVVKKVIKFDKIPLTDTPWCEGLSLLQM